MATHSSILASKVPWTEKPGRLIHGLAKGWTRLSDQRTTKNICSVVMYNVYMLHVIFIALENMLTSSP